MNVKQVDASEIRSNGAAVSTDALKVLGGAAIGAVLIPAAASFAGIGLVGSFGAIGLSALELSAVGAAAGAAVGASNKSSKHSAKPPAMSADEAADYLRKQAREARARAKHWASERFAEEPESPEINDLRNGVF